MDDADRGVEGGVEPLRDRVRRPVAADAGESIATAVPKSADTKESTGPPTWAALEPAIGLRSVLAVELLRVRDAARDPVPSGRPAREWVGAEAVWLLSWWRHGAGRADGSGAEYCWALARLGGHQNRVGDGPPGGQTLWKGQMKLQAMLPVATAVHEFHAPKQPG